MSKIDVDFGGWMQEAFELYKKDFAVLLLVNLVALVLSFITAFVLSGPMYAGVAIVTLGLLDGTSPKPVVGDVFKGFQFFLPSFLLMLVILAATMVVSMVLGPLSTIATWVFSTITMFSIFLIVEQKMDFWPAIVASYEVVKENFWVLLALVIVASIVSTLGFIACCVGIFVTMPFYYCVLAVAYRKIVGAPSGPTAATDDEPLVRISPPPPAP